MAELRLRMLGTLKVVRDGAAVALPASRKVRALLGYLALATQPVPRSRLCELLWDSPGDPRGELRWSLSKIRTIVGGRVLTPGDAVALDLAGCAVDARQVASATAEGIEALDLTRARALAAIFCGEFLDGLEMDRSPVFGAWLTAQRRRFRACFAALLESLARRLPDDESLAYLERWRETAPFDLRVHEALFATLARLGRIREGDEHLEASVRLFDAEGLDTAPLRAAWQALRSRNSIELLGSCHEISDKDERQRRSVAVMPFASLAPHPHAAAHALAHDVITRLAKLRSLFVIGRGTVFALHERGIGAEEAGRRLDVDYVVSGSVRSRGERLSVAVELAETRSARIVWADEFDEKADDAFLVLDELGNRIVSSIAGEIEMLERNRALLKPPASLDAWEAYHRGLWHMYRYRRDDNEQAARFFGLALRLDPTFSRAYAGLSFTHFQKAFQSWEEAAPHVEKAYECATEGLLADERDPAAHWAMGRALYLRRDFDESLASLERSIELSPNFALGHYNLSFVRSLVGDPRVAIADADYSRKLSPYDPMLFGMLATRAMSLVRLQKFDEASQWAIKAAARPNAFPHIHAIAAYSLALAGALERARSHAAAARRTAPLYNIGDFLQTFSFEPEGERLFRKGAALVGMA